ncbi:hypothetical protein, partial [Ruthenibacterium lactatiformans]
VICLSINSLYHIWQHPVPFSVRCCLNAFRSIGQVAGSMVSGFSYTVGHALPFFCASAFFMMMVFILRWGTSGERKRHANGGIKRRKKNG